MVDKKRIGIYCRVSTDEQNIEQQRQLLIDYCNKNSYTFRSYLDEAVSGSISDRPQWIKLLDECDKNKFDIILVQKYDRITRDLFYSLHFLDWLKNHPNIKLISLYDGEFDWTPDKVFIFKLQCLLSEYELSVNKWRRDIGVARAKKEGKYIYGRGRPKPK